MYSSDPAGTSLHYLLIDIRQYFEQVYNTNILHVIGYLARTLTILVPKSHA